MQKLKYRLIGISGTNGSGKDTLGHLLEDRYQFKFLSLSDLLREELRHRSQEVKRENLRGLSAEWRREGGLAVLIDKGVEEYENSFMYDHLGLAVASLRNPAEADEIHRLGGTVVWVDADPEIRYARVQYAHRGRTGEDEKTFEEFLAEEQDEMHPGADDAALLNMAGVKERSDVEVFNNSTELDHFIRTIDESLKALLQST